MSYVPTFTGGSCRMGRGSDFVGQHIVQKPQPCASHAPSVSQIQHSATPRRHQQNQGQVKLLSAFQKGQSWTTINCLMLYCLPKSSQDPET